MRITVEIDDDVLSATKALAERRGISLGSALSELARHGFRRASLARKGEDDTVFDVPSDAEAITTEDVRRALADQP